MRTVEDILENKSNSSNIVSPDTLVIDGLRMLDSVNLSYLVVMNGDEYKGIFSERDYCRNVVLKGRSSASSTVQEIMSTDLPTVELTDTAEHCMNMIGQRKTRYLVCFYEDGQLAGVVTIHDLLRLVLLSKENVFDYTLTKDLLENDEGGLVY